MIVTEFYTKGEDSGMPNPSGAGWIVPTQADRGWFYQNLVLGLLESGGSVGAHWFQYMDSNPAATNSDPSNIDSNKGVVNIQYARYDPLLDRMKLLNDDLYAIIGSMHDRGAP